MGFKSGDNNNQPKVEVNGNNNGFTADTTSNATAAGNTSTTGVNSGFNNRANTASTALGFGINQLQLMTSNQGSKYTTAIGKTMLELYAKFPIGGRPKVHVMDKEVNSRLAYSTIVVSSIADGNDVNYFIITLGATGKKPLKVSEAMAEVINAKKMPNQRPNIHTTDDAIDGRLHDEVIKVLVREYPSASDFISVEGIAVTTEHIEPEVLALDIAVIAYNACYMDKMLATGEVTDLNITEGVNGSKNAQLKVETSLIKSVHKDAVGKSVRADFKANLVSIGYNNNLTSLNLQDNIETLTSVTGYVDAIPEEVIVPTMPGMPPQTNIRLHPHIVLTSNETSAPTIGYMLLSVINGLVMTNTDMWVPAVLPDASGDIHNTGALNLLTNIGNNQNKVGEILDLTSKSISKEEAYGFVKQMYSLSPIVSMDVESFGTQSFYTSVMALAAGSGGDTLRQNAAEEIIRTANWLTNGYFDKDFPINDIFANEAVMVPLGRWFDKSGERDVRDIDLSFIAGYNGDIELMNDFSRSFLPRSITNVDPYIAKLEIISKIIPDAEITGKAHRVTFTSNFISALITAAKAAGLNSTYQPAVEFVENNTISMLSTHLQGAGITDTSAFGRQLGQQQGYGAYNPYAAMGGRFGHQ